MDAFNENFNAIDKAVAAKADQTELDALAGQVKTKADKTALDAEKTARETALAALAGRSGSLETGKLLYKFGTYTGDGQSGKSAHTRLELPFNPHH